MKRKETKDEKRSTVKYEEVGNIEKNVFVIFVVFLKQSEKERKLMVLTTTNDSTNMLTS